VRVRLKGASVRLEGAHVQWIRLRVEGVRVREQRARARVEGVRAHARENDARTGVHRRMSHLFAMMRQRFWRPFRLTK